MFSLGLAQVACAKGASDDTTDFDAGSPPKRDGGADGSMNGGNDASSQPDTAQDDSGSCVKAPPSNVCGLDPQCGCGGNQTCDVDLQKLDGTTSCVNAGGGMIKAKCSKTSDCAPGLTCLFGACRPYCSQDGAACAQPNTSQCKQLTNSSNQPIKNLLVCYLKCTLDDTTSCGGGGVGCIYGGMNDVTDCRDLSAFGTTSCSQNNPYCAAGYVCLSNNQCAKWCKVGVTVCGGGKTCVSLNPMVKMGNQEFGVCN